MKLLRVLALVTFVAGAAFLVIGLACSDGSGDKTQAEDVFVALAATATPTPPATVTPTVEPTATPTPYNGNVEMLKIPRFEVASPIEPIGLLPNNQLDVPKNPHNTGWYDIYDKPGFSGNSVFSAHVDYFPNILGPFHKLSKAEIGDEIEVVMDNGLEYKYRVIRKERYDVDAVPMGELIWPAQKPKGTEWITLITCGGQFQQTNPDGSGKYLHRDVVVAERYQ